jgi:hypothetical protein
MTLTDRQATVRLNNLSKQEAGLKTGFALATDEDAVRELSTLSTRERQQVGNLGMTALAMGDLALQIAPIGPDTGREAFERLDAIAKRARPPVKIQTLRDRRLVASRIPPVVRTYVGFLTCASYSVYKEVCNAKPDEEERMAFFARLHTEQPVDDNGQTTDVWTRDVVLRMLNRNTKHNPLNIARNASVEQRQQILRELVADPAVLHPVINDRDTSGTSQVERAFFQARAPHEVEIARQLAEAREIGRELEEQTRLGSPSLTNRIFLDRVFARTRLDATRYQQLAHDLSEPMIQQFAAHLAASRIHFEWLRDAAQACLDTIGEAPVPETDDDGVIDVEARAAVERFMLIDADRGEA